ncbi:DsbA family protein [Pseudooceanicola aestuarii]|uniref:DsbA family protein n=1 Tax=Pseudooceanicola aestuarii TaxID=2697319 RepID=UPI0013D4D35B|nr:DsbA family protein [Pseudooceanicola aestuarii]
MNFRQTALAATAALAFTQPAAAEMTDAERETFRDEVRAYLMEHPEIIIEAVQSMETRQAEQAAANDVNLVRANADDIFDDGHSWVGGNPEGDVTLVEFMDYRCGYCRRAYEDVEKLIEEDGNIRFVLKEFPILGEASTLSSRFAVATQQVAGDDAYKAVHDALMSYDGAYDPAALTRLAEGLGLDAQPILAEMDSDEVNRILSENHALARRMQVNGTPTFILDDQMLRGYVPYDGMKQIVAEMRAE